MLPCACGHPRSLGGCGHRDVCDSRARGCPVSQRPKSPRLWQPGPGSPGAAGLCPGAAGRSCRGHSERPVPPFPARSGPAAHQPRAVTSLQHGTARRKLFISPRFKLLLAHRVLRVVFSEGWVFFPAEVPRVRALHPRRSPVRGAGRGRQGALPARCAPRRWIPSPSLLSHRDPRSWRFYPHYSAIPALWG